MQIPENFKNRMQDMLGDEYDDFINAYENAPLYSAVRINTLKENSDKAVSEEFALKERVLWCNEGYYINKSEMSGNHPYHLGGLFYFQEPSAMSAVEALPIEEGDFVLDLCAAPGGKSTQAAAKLNGSGLLVSNEIVKKRASILSGNIERMGIKNAVVTNETPQKLSEKYPCFFDKIIVDAPCSGEGMFRKEPQAVEEWSEEHTKSCGIRQKNILDCAVKMLKAGGLLVYSTCTFAPCENEEIAEYLITEHNMEIQPIKTLDMLDNGRNEWGSGKSDVSLSKRIFPQNAKGEGHFVALFKKTEQENAYKPKKSQKPDLVLEKAIKLYRDFEKNSLNIEIDGSFKLFGDMLYVLPYELDIEKIKVLRYGLCLGECKKGRFEPSHALALALKYEDFRNKISFDIKDMNLEKFLKGNVFPAEISGYTAVCVNEYPIGWGKGSGGIMKNKIPKGLRIF